MHGAKTLCTQTHCTLLAETLLLLFELTLLLFFSLLLGFLFGSTLGGFLFLSLLLGFVVATLALQLLLNRLVDSLRSLTQSDGGLLVGRVGDDGDITGMSFAFEDDWEDSENGVSYEKTNDIEDGKEVWLRHVKKITGLYDVAIVTHPAYEQTNVGLREASEAIDKAIEAQLKRECGDKDDKREDDPDDKGETDEEREAREKAEREANGGETNAEKEAREAKEREANGGETNAEKEAREQAEREANGGETNAEKEAREQRELEEAAEQHEREMIAMRLHHRALRMRTEQELESLIF